MAYFSLKSLLTAIGILNTTTGTSVDEPLAVDGADEDATSRSQTSLSKRIANALKAINTGTSRIPAQGQALAAASTPVVLPALQVTDLKAVTEASAANILASTGAVTDAPTAYDGAAEDGTAKSGIQLWKRMCNALAAIAAPLVAAYNAVNTSFDTTETSPVALQRDDSETYINGVSATTSGAWKNFNTMAIVKFFCHVTAWTSGTVTFSLYTNNTASDTGRILLHSEVLSAAGDKEIAVVGDPGLLQMVVTISDVATATVGYKAKGA